MHQWPERERRIGDTAGDDDVSAFAERLGDGRSTQIRIGEQQALAHRLDVCGGIHVGECLAAALNPLSRNARATASRAPCGLSPPAFITNLTPRGAASGHNSVSIGTQSRA